MELKKRRQGERYDAEERRYILSIILLNFRRKKRSRENRVIAKKAHGLRGIKAKIFNK